VYAVNPLQSARARQGNGVSGAKSDAGDAHVLADLVRTRCHQLRTVAGDSEQAGAVKVLTRMHQTLIWDRTRQVLRLRSSLREFFPAALEAYEDLASPDVLELLTKAPEPGSAAALTRAQITAALKRARRRGREAKTTAIMVALAAEHLTQPPLIAAAYGATVRALARHEPHDSVCVCIRLYSPVKLLTGRCARPWKPPSPSTFPTRTTVPARPRPSQSTRPVTTSSMVKLLSAHSATTATAR